MVAQASIPAAREAEVSQDNLARPCGREAHAVPQPQALSSDRALGCRPLSPRMAQALAETANAKDALLSNSC